MQLIITIDTEEDNWGDYNARKAEISHLSGIRKVQKLFDEFSVRPTYLLTYPMASHGEVVDTLGLIQSDGRCEIGSHCHPWNTPPYEERTDAYNSMLCNLPAKLQERKIESLHERIKESFSSSPTSFRCGRWGFGASVAAALVKMSYIVDSSVTAFTDWSMYHGPDYSMVPPEPYRISYKDISEENPQGELVEIPATVGFIQRNFSFSNRLLRITEQGPLKAIRASYVLRRLGLVNMVSLSPELSDLEQMKRLTRTMMECGYEVLNVFFHSPSLVAGLSPFVQTKEDERRLFDTLRGFLSYTEALGIESATLTEAALCCNTET